MSREISTIQLPLQLRDYQKKAIDKRLLAHGLLYNAVLSELFKRIEKYHNDPIYSLASTKKNNKRKIELRKKLGLSKFETMKIGNRAWNKSGNALLDGKTVEATSQRAWVHCQDYLKYKKNKPEFKNPYYLDSVSANGNKQNLRLSQKRLDNNLEQVSLLWSNRSLPKKKSLDIKIDWKQKSLVRQEWLISNYAKIKHLTIKRELIRGTWKYYLIITLNAKPYRSKQEVKPRGALAIDTGPAKSKGVNQDGQVINFEVSLKEKENFRRIEQQITEKQRKLERSLRANNLDAYEENGTLKPNRKLDNRSNNAQQLQKDLHELYRKRRVVKKMNTIKRVKEIAKEYKTVIVENVSYQAWFTRYSKSMKIFTPGLFQNLLEKELELQGGKLEKLPLTYAFSQTCYCGKKTKKPLSQREHECEQKGCPAQNKKINRDVFSGLLMLTVFENKINLKTYQERYHNGPGYGFLPERARTTIETRLDLLDNNTLSSYPEPTTIYDTEQKELNDNNSLLPFNRK